MRGLNWQVSDPPCYLGFGLNRLMFCGTWEFESWNPQARRQPPGKATAIMPSVAVHFAACRHASGVWGLGLGV